MSVSIRPYVKSAFLWSYIHLWRAIPRYIRGLQERQRVVVLVYHRVNDEHQDLVTVGISQFEEQMRFIAHHYPVVALKDIVSGNISRSSNRPVVAVTFDDGYLDNYENAAPILERYKIPATFFVTTGFIGTTRAFAHDLRRKGAQIPCMTWDQVRSLHERGFCIGSHTVSHINCAAGPLAQVRQELIDSREDLRTMLGIEHPLFAYPFGAKDDITADVINMLPELGYSGCCSAYGGYNGEEIDPYDIRRVGVDYRFTRLAFQARIEGYQLLRWWRALFKEKAKVGFSL